MTICAQEFAQNWKQSDMLRPSFPVFAINPLLDSCPNGTLCSSGLQDTFEVASNARLNMNTRPFYGIVFLGENNILYMMMLFEWISASFALYYIGMYARDAGFGTPQKSFAVYIVKREINYQYWVPFMITLIGNLWNVVLFFIIAIMGSNGNEWNVPENNTTLGCILLIITIVIQWLVEPSKIESNPSNKPTEPLKDSKARLGVRHSNERNTFQRLVWNYPNTRG